MHARISMFVKMPRRRKNTLFLAVTSSYSHEAVVELHPKERGENRRILLEARLDDASDDRLHVRALAFAGVEPHLQLGVAHGSGIKEEEEDNNKGEAGYGGSASCRSTSRTSSHRSEDLEQRRKMAGLK